MDRCRAEGVQVQNSVTRLDEQTVPVIKAWFSSAPAKGDETLS
jgi:hypothetical protein